MIDSQTIITELCPGLGTYDFNQDSLYDVLSRDYGLVVAKISHIIQIIEHTVSHYRADRYEYSITQSYSDSPL